MNTDVAAWLWTDASGAVAWLREAEDFFAEVEAELSRFRPESGLSRLNAAAGRGPQPVSAMLLDVLTCALAAAEESDGIFDPTVLPALRRAGYDRSFELLAGEAAPGNGVGTEDAMRAGLDWRSVEVSPVPRTVTLPTGVQIDLGGIAKGWTVDRVAEMLGAWGAALVDAGGDIRASAAPGGVPWPIGVEDPFAPVESLGALQLTDGAVATSTIGRRHWVRNGQIMHHLIDPRTGEPCHSDLHTVTALAPTVVRAEVAAKTALILGSIAGRAYLERRGLSGLLIDRGGDTQLVGEIAMSQYALSSWEN